MKSSISLILRQNASRREKERMWHACELCEKTDQCCYFRFIDQVNSCKRPTLTDHGKSDLRNDFHYARLFPTFCPMWLSSSILLKANHIGRYELSNRLDVLLKHHEQIIFFGFDPLILILTVRIPSTILTARNLVILHKEVIHSVVSEVFRNTKCNIHRKWYPCCCDVSYNSLTKCLSSLSTEQISKTMWKRVTDDNKMDNHTSWIRIKAMWPSYSFSVSVDR